MPVVLLRALGQQLPRVRATESLRRAAEVALGSGTLKKEDARELRGKWIDQAGAGVPRRLSTARDVELFAQQVGIELVKEKVANG